LGQELLNSWPGERDIGWGWKVLLALTRNTGGYTLESHEAHIGALVRVLDGGKRRGKGRVGTVERTFGHPSYLASEVRFEDGSLELYWYHELGKFEGTSRN
jgi:hypothetical protein